jgi:hypothetical protein
MELFEIINNIFEKKGGELPSNVLTSYSNFMANRAISQYKELVFFANELNQLTVDKDMHYKFLYNAISKKRRFAKWNKTVDDKKSISIIQEYYGYSYSKAKEVLPLLINNLNFMKSQLDKGGRK